MRDYIGRWKSDPISTNEKSARHSSLDLNEIESDIHLTTVTEKISCSTNLYSVNIIREPELNPTVDQLSNILHTGSRLPYITPDNSTTDLRVIHPSGGADVLSKYQTVSVGIDLQQAYNGKFLFLSKKCELSPNGQLPSLTPNVTDQAQWARRIRPSERIIKSCNSFDWSTHAW